jgi:hypothetical protein
MTTKTPNILGNDLYALIVRVYNPKGEKIEETRSFVLDHDYALLGLLNRVRQRHPTATRVTADIALPMA